MNGIHDLNRARAALQSIPPDLPRDEWVRVLMAGQSAGLDGDELRAWSEQGESYKPRDFTDTMRKMEPGRGVSAATLFYLAREHGWNDGDKPQRKSPSKLPKQTAATPPAPRPGMTPADVWARCEPATNAHLYITRKAAAGVPLDTLRVVPQGDPLHIGGNSMAGALAVPAYAGGKLQSLQFIPPQGKKMNLPGAPMAGASHTVGTPGDGPLYLVEGIGQAWACWQATGRAAVVCFGWGNVGTVAQRLHQNGYALVLVPDAGKEAQAEAIARELGCSVAAMPQGEAQNFDCNDLAQRDGADVLAALLESAQSFKPEPLLTPVDVAGVLTHPSPPPRFVWDGYCPRGVVTLLGAHGGTGKSTIALMLAVAVATGRELFGIATDAAPVVFASFEDGAHIVRHRLAHVCQCWGINPAELAGLHIVDGTANPELFASDGRGPGDVTPAYGELLALVKQTGAGLVIVDNASDAYGGDEIQRRQVRAFMRALAVIAREGDAAVMLLAHVDKGTSRRDRSDTEGYSGSTAWHNSARSRIFMSRDDSGLLMLAHQKSNLAKLREPLTLEWPAGGLPDAAQALSPAVQGISDRVDTKSLLKLIAEFSERGEHVTTATTSRTHAAKLLCNEPGYPKGRTTTDVFDLLRKAERAGHIERTTYQGADRKPREAWRVTDTGRHLAELPPIAATAATPRDFEVTAPAEGCGDCGDSASTSTRKFRNVMSPKLAIGILSCELPLDGSAQRVSVCLPSIDFASQKLLAWQAAVQALAREDADFDLGHVQPACMLGRVVKAHPTQQRAGSSLAQHVVEAFPEVGIQVVQHEVNAARPRVRFAQECLDEADEVRLAPVIGDRDDALSRLGLDRHEQIGRSLAHVFVVQLGRLTRRHGQGFAAMSNELHALLVDANHGLVAAHRFGIQLEQLVHAAAVFFGERADAPHQPPPGLEIVFFSMRRTVSRLTLPRPTSWRAARSSSTIVQRWRPLGGAEHASAVTRAWASVSYRRGRPERATSNTARSTPPCRYADRVRHSAVRPIPSTSMICVSGTPRSRHDSACARFTSRE